MRWAGQAVAWWAVIAFGLLLARGWPAVWVYVGVSAWLGAGAFACAFIAVAARERENRGR